MLTELQELVLEPDSDAIRTYRSVSEGRKERSPPLAEINQINPIYVYFTISELDLLRLMSRSQGLLSKVNAKKFPVAIGLADDTAAAPFQCPNGL